MNEYLYHYTNKAGYEGILSTGTFWLKLVSAQTNDNEDTIYIRKVIENLRNKKYDNAYYDYALKVLGSVLSARKNKDDDYLTNFVYRLCFSQTRNNEMGLSRYDSKNDVYLITFEKVRLIEYFCNTAVSGDYFDRFVPREVIYDKIEQEKFIFSFIYHHEKNYIDKESKIKLNTDYLSSTPLDDFSGLNPVLKYDFSKRKWLIEDVKDTNYIHLVTQGILWTNLANDFYINAPFIKKPDKFFISENEYRFSFNRNRYKNYKDKYTEKIIIPIEKNCIVFDESGFIGKGKKLGL